MKSITHLYILFSMMHTLTTVAMNQTTTRVDYNTSLDHQLIAASGKGDASPVATLLSKKANPNAIHGNKSPLHEAASHGCTAIAKRLLRANADVDLPLEHNVTPLHSAAFAGTVAMAELLLAHGANIYAKTEDFTSALDAAASTDHGIRITKLILNAPETRKNKNSAAPRKHKRRGAAVAKRRDVDLADTSKVFFGATATREKVFLNAAATGDVGSIKSLLDGKKLKKNLVNSVNEDGETALHLATVNGHVGAVRTLLENKAKVDAIAQNNNLTALHLAAINGRTPIIPLLLAAKANINARSNSTKRTPLHLAILSGMDEAARFLVEAKANLDCKDSWESLSALDTARKQKNNELVKFLQEHGAIETK